MAIKSLKKAEIIRIKQVDHVISENNILASIAHPFIVGKCKTNANIGYYGWLYTR